MAWKVIYGLEHLRAPARAPAPPPRGGGRRAQ